MTRRISQWLYRKLLFLHPEAFRREFEDEMLGIFEECRRAQGLPRLLADVFHSAVKQQLHYLATPEPERAPLYSEVASAPGLARVLAFAVFAAALFAGAFLPAATPKASDTWTRLGPEQRTQYPQCSEEKPARVTSEARQSN